tara:strand:- start:50 stop:268 length:219 start_codon:yes stop_codon:yes gene_type:complete
MPNRIEVNCTTGEVSEIELTADEVAANEAKLAEHTAQVEADKAAAEAKAAAKASGDAKLKELGLTDEEIAAR